MSQAASKSHPDPAPVAAPESAAREIPTVIATDLLEKLITDRDAHAVDRVVIATKRH